MAEYVTAMIGGQLFGLPISRVQDVFMPARLTRVPLSSSEIAGVLNLRGRIVTVVDMRARPGPAQGQRRLKPADGGRRRSARRILMASLIDQIGEVLRLAEDGPRGKPRQSRSPHGPSSPAASTASTDNS